MSGIDMGNARGAWPEAGAGGGRAHHAGGLPPDVPGDRRGAVRPGVPRLAGLLQTSGIPQPGAGTLPGGGQRASGPGRADGRALGASGGGGDPRGLRFDGPVPDGGYVWWYLDALSDDGVFGLTAIAFLGSVFSPYYAWA